MPLNNISNSKSKSMICKEGAERIKRKGNEK